jgi:hypothetical protein
LTDKKGKEVLEILLLVLALENLFFINNCNQYISKVNNASISPSSRFRLRCHSCR